MAVEVKALGNESETNSSATAIETTEMKAGNILTNSQDDVNWDYLKTEIELLDTSWSVVLYDLYKIDNNDNNQILKFSDILNNSIISIKEENKADSITNLAQLYSYIPEFVRISSNDNNLKNIKETKKYIIDSYASVTNDDWTTATSALQSAEENFSNIFKDLEYMKKNEYKVNKTYILLKELQNCLEQQDKSIFFMKYINLMENLNMM